MALGGLGGVASGVDTGARIEQLMGLERKARDRMDLCQAQIGARQAGLGTEQARLLARRAGATTDDAVAAINGAADSPVHATKDRRPARPVRPYDGHLQRLDGDVQLSALQKQMAAEDARPAGREARLRAQFAAMEFALGAAQAQQSWLQSRLAAFDR